MLNINYVWTNYVRSYQTWIYYTPRLFLPMEYCTAVTVIYLRLLFHVSRSGSAFRIRIKNQFEKRLFLSSISVSAYSSPDKNRKSCKRRWGYTVCPFQDPHFFIRELHKETWFSELFYPDANDIRTLYGKIKDKKTLTRMFFHHYQIPFNNKLSALCVVILCLMGELAFIFYKYNKCIFCI